MVRGETDTSTHNVAVTILTELPSTPSVLELGCELVDCFSFGWVVRSPLRDWMSIERDSNDPMFQE
jgi:hypothetical protein